MFRDDGLLLTASGEKISVLRDIGQVLFLL